MKNSYRNDNTANKIKCSGCLFMAALIWGMAFVSQSKGMEFMGPFTFNGVRSFIGATVLFLFVLLTGRLNRKKRVGSLKDNLLGGICCGVVLTFGSTLQQVGLQYTTVGKAGFITTLYIVFVPILGIFIKKKVSYIIWIATLAAAVGMYLLCMTESLTIAKGDFLMFLCAIAFALHIMVVDFFTHKADGVLLSCIQFLVCGLLASFGALAFEKPTFSGIILGIGPLLYAGVMSSGIAFTLQIIGQKGLNPTVAALICSLESVIATVAGFVAYKIGFLTTDQSMTGRQIAGCIIVFASVIIVQLPSEWFGRKH